MAGAASPARFHFDTNALVNNYDRRLTERAITELGNISNPTCVDNKITYDLKDTSDDHNQIGQITLCLEEGKPVRIIAPIAVSPSANLSEVEMVFSPSRAVLALPQNISNALVDQAFLVSEVWSKCMTGPEGLIVEEVMTRETPSWIDLGFKVQELSEGQMTQPTRTVELSAEAIAQKRDDVNLFGGFPNIPAKTSTPQPLPTPPASPPPVLRDRTPSPAPVRKQTPPPAPKVTPRQRPMRKPTPPFLTICRNLIGALFTKIGNLAESIFGFIWNFFGKPIL